MLGFRVTAPHSLTRRSVCALIATMTVLSDISTAPTAARQHDAPRRQHAGGQRDRDDVVAGRPPEVLHHLAVGRPAERDDSRHVSRIASHEHDVARLDGDVRAGADRDPDVRRTSAGASLTPSPTIATRLPCRCTSWIFAAFSSGSTSANTVSMPSSAATAFGDGLRIAGHHDDFDPVARAAAEPPRATPRRTASATAKTASGLSPSSR